MTKNNFTIRIEKEIVLETSNTIEARQKIATLKKELTPVFTFSNNIENFTFSYIKRREVDGYYGKMEQYIKPDELPTLKETNREQ